MIKSGLIKDISFANWKQVQHFQRGNAHVSGLIASIYKNKISTELFENITKIEKNNLKSKYKSSYAGFKVQKTLLIYLTGICESCLRKGKNLGTYSNGCVKIKKKSHKKETSQNNSNVFNSFSSKSYNSLEVLYSLKH
jgi:hypothetical protein